MKKKNLPNLTYNFITLCFVIVLFCPVTVRSFTLRTTSCTLALHDLIESTIENTFFYLKRSIKKKSVFWKSDHARKVLFNLITFTVRRACGGSAGYELFVPRWRWSAAFEFSRGLASYIINGFAFTKTPCIGNTFCTSVSRCDETLQGSRSQIPAELDRNRSG